MLRCVPLVLGILAVALPVDEARAAQNPVAAECALSPADQAWVDRSIAAWRFTVREITRLSVPERTSAFVFDADCILSSETAMSVDGSVAWDARSHHGTISLPGDITFPAGVTSFAGQAEDGAFFVMSTPIVWEAGGVPGGPMGLETLMTAVLIHEGSHVVQGVTYMRQFSEVAEAAQLPETFNDDSIQERFESDADFAASIARETDLLFEAAATADSQEARRLAGEALALIQARRARFYTGEDAFLAQAEDIFLTLEGSGQWAGYHWLVHPQGASLPPAEVLAAFGRRSRWWSQIQGLALALATDRLDDGTWRATVFGDGGSAGIALLERALNDAPTP
jgi:hypothetical protein